MHSSQVEGDHSHCISVEHDIFRSLDIYVLQELFMDCGTINEIRIPVFKATQVGKGFAFVEFEQEVVFTLDSALCVEHCIFS